MLKRLRRSNEPGTATVSLYYASDVHGSEQCWRKFLGAGRFYRVDALIMGGDLTGKGVVPITVDGSGAFEATFLGERQAGAGEEQLEELRAAIRYNGLYPWEATADEVVRVHDDPAAQEALFDQVMAFELGRWIALADERMEAAGIAVYVMPGNDDPPVCDAVIEGATWVTACDERIVRVGPHEMISCAYANPTPWNSPRELDESALYDHINQLAQEVEDPSTAIFNLHVPPYDTGLDTANEINADLTLVYRGGQPSPIPVGSTAVRQIIEEYQPLLALHGHIHESRGEAYIGRTLCINSGSEYNSGQIHGVTVKLADSAVLAHQFVIG
jgi:Icc-related predicted phosphoesterase